VVANSGRQQYPVSTGHCERDPYIQGDHRWRHEDVPDDIPKIIPDIPADPRTLY
jgi:hypothetical protein